MDRKQKTAIKIRWMCAAICCFLLFFFLSAVINVLLWCRRKYAIAFQDWKSVQFIGDWSDQLLEISESVGLSGEKYYTRAYT